MSSLKRYRRSSTKFLKQKKYKSLRLKILTISFILAALPLTFYFSAQPTAKKSHPRKNPVETRSIIAVLDTGLPMRPELKPYLCKMHMNGTTYPGIQDKMGHATNVSFAIAQSIDPSKACISICKWYAEKNTGYENVQAVNRCWEYADQIGAKWVNFSAGGPEPLQNEYLAIRKLLRKGVKVSVAAENDGADLSKDCSNYPACYRYGESEKKNFFVVGSNEGMYTNFNGPVNAIEDGYYCDPVNCMHGTSMSTAVWTGKLVKQDFEPKAFCPVVPKEQDFLRRLQIL